MLAAIPMIYKFGDDSPVKPGSFALSSSFPPRDGGGGGGGDSLL